MRKATKKKKATAKRKATKKSAARKKAAPKRKTTAKKKITAKKKAAAKRKPAKKAAAKRAAPKKPKAKRKPSAAFMRPWTVSTELGAVVGMKPMPRTEVTKKLWDYIKKNKLQDPVNRRMINADENLRKVFGKPKVTMFEMTKLVSKHLK
ncbi:MAG: SWIB/MDM2 domain-containing protein [Candidatus Zixiibacteriota bacterium]